MKAFEHLDTFLAKASKDPRIGIAHIGLFAALAVAWQKQGNSGPVRAFAREMMDACKISSTSTYHKLIHELSDYGYVRFEVSYKKNSCSSIYLY